MNSSVDFTYFSLLVINALICVWVYLDSSKNKIGYVQADPVTGLKPKFANMSAGLWGFLTGIGGAVFAVFYITCRSKLLQRASASPKVSKGRGLKASALFVWSCIVIAVGIALMWAKPSRSQQPWLVLMPQMVVADGVKAVILREERTVPSCTSPHIIKLAEQIIHGSPLIQTLGVQVVGLTDPVEKGYDSNEEERYCDAVLTHSLGTEIVSFVVRWHDKNKNLYVVEF